MKFLKRWAKRNSHIVLVKPFAGFGKSINRFYENRNHDHHSNGELTVLRKLGLIKPKVIFDVGANIGEYAILTKKACPTAQLYCFEPVSATNKILKINLAKEGIADVEIIQKGLSGETKSININLYDASAHSSIHTLKGVGYTASSNELIEVDAGDQIMKELNIDHIDFIKLDIEGAEMSALQGFSKAFSNKKIRAVQFEYGYINISTKDLLCDFYDFFEQYGYQLGKVYPKHVEFRPYSFSHEDFMGPNYLAILKSDTELRKILEK